MALDFPLEYTLESGTHVTVNRIETKQYEFLLTPDEGDKRTFLYNDEVEYTTEMEEKLEFDELNALRRFWLEREKDNL